MRDSKGDDSSELKEDKERLSVLQEMMIEQEESERSQRKITGLNGSKEIFYSDEQEL